MDAIETFLRYHKALDEGWTHCSWVEIVEQRFWSEPTAQIAESFDYNTVTDWCRERCNGDWVVSGGSVLLKDPRDAMLFKLTFGVDSYKNTS